MTIANVRKSVIGIINEVQLRLGLSKTTTISTNHSEMLLNFLNDVIDEISDFGDWPQMYREWKVTAQASVGSYEVIASADVKNIYEISWGDDISPLEVRTVEDIKRLQRVGSFGTPRQFAIVGVSGVNPLFRVSPIPTQTTIDAETSAGGVFDVTGYKKPRLLTTSDVSAIPAFPSRLLSQGLYTKAVLEEAGGEATNQYQVAYAEYARMRNEALNRLTADTGTDVYFTPTGGRYA